MIKRKFTEPDLFENSPVSPSQKGFRARLRIGTDGDRYVYQQFYAATELDVKIKVREYIQAQIDGQEERRKIDALLSTDFEKFLYCEKYGTLKAGSFDRCEGIYKHQIAPYISYLTVQGCTSVDCKRILDKNLAQGYSYSVLVKTRQLLNEYFEKRRKSGDLTINPMDGVKMYSKDFVQTRQQQIREDRQRAKEKLETGANLTPTEEGLAFSKLKMEDKEEIRILTEEEITRIKDVCINGYYTDYTSRSGNPVHSGPHYLTQPKFFLFMLNTGIRSGEARALKYSDVDFERKTIAIKRNVTVSKRRDARGHAIGGMIVTENSPKTDRSAAVLPVSQAALDILRELLAEEPPGYNGYIVHDDNRNRLGETGLRKRWVSLLHWAKVDPCGLHSLRHTFASRLYAATRGDSKLVSEMVRHSNVAFTENIYIHLIEQYRENC